MCVLGLISVANPPLNTVTNDIVLVLTSWINQPLYLSEWHCSLQDEERSRVDL